MKVIHTDNAPQAIGPYSQAIVTGNLVFASGQIAIVPSTGAIVEGGIVEQTELVCKNIGELFAKPGRNYSTRGAKILYNAGRRAHWWSPIWHGCAAFFVNYFIRGGILGGIDGLTFSKAVALNSYLKYAKLLEYQRDPKVREEEDFTSVW